MALEMHTSCERCGIALAQEGEATIADCAVAMGHGCPNCGGELVRRPRRSG
jgi:uncharacterized protein